MFVILGCVFLLTKAHSFRSIILKKRLTFREQIGYAMFFGVVGILGTHTGFQTTYAIANTRAVAVITAGLIGGPWVGLGAGLIAGTERYFLGGVSVFSSSGSTIIEGVLAGLYYSRFNALHVRWPYAMGVGFFLEALHMLIVLFFSKNYDQALQIVQTITPSMLLINPLGIAVFIAILDSIYGEQEKVEGKAAKLALQIAGKTLVYLRMGLNEKNAYQTATTIFQCVGNLDAVVITSLDNVLAFIGTGADHHKGVVQTTSTMELLATGNCNLAKNKEDIGCKDPDCPLQSKIIVALKDQETIIGSLGFYKVKPNSITPFEIELIKGLSQLISTQLEVSKVEQYSALRAAAEIKALQAQINPHFLFNAINTIVYYCRSQPETARNLLLNLADFYRNNLSRDGEWVNLQTEIQHVDAYVQIEAARFQGKLHVNYDFPEQYHKKIPSLILQPIVENAIKHGLYPKKVGGTITVSGCTILGNYIVTITDNGVGIPEDKLNVLLEENQDCSVGGARIGLLNVHQRLQTIYGSEYGLTITSDLENGTRVSLAFPA
jgi:two-component system sensor histidine kinase LytS